MSAQPTILKDELRELAERVEAATGPDREIDREIELAIFPDRISPPVGLPLLEYTASLDAAMQLVPEGYCGQVQFGKHPGAWIEPLDEENPADFNVAATPALALTAAALRARASIEGK